jgi:hypothetical protein
MIDSLLTKLGISGATEVLSHIESVISAIEEAIASEKDKTMRNDAIDAAIAVLTLLKDK